MSDINIFDTTNIDDINDDVKNMVVIKKTIRVRPAIKELFKIKKKITLNEIIVGLYRKFDIKAKQRGTVKSHMYHLIYEGFLIKVTNEIETYELIED